MLYFVDKEAYYESRKHYTLLNMNKIIRLLIDKATSRSGAENVRKSAARGNSISQIDLRQEQTAAALDRLFKKGVFLLETIMIFPMPASTLPSAVL